MRVSGISVINVPYLLAPDPLGEGGLGGSPESKPGETPLPPGETASLGENDDSGDEFLRTQFRIVLAYEACNAHNYDEAIRYSTLAIQGNPNLPIAYHVRGDAYLGVGKNDLAVADYTQAINLSKNPKAIYNYGRGKAYPGLCMTLLGQVAGIRVTV